MGPKKRDDGVDDLQAERHTREYGRIPNRQGARSPVANAIREDDMDARYGRAPGKTNYREGGEVTGPEAAEAAAERRANARASKTRVRVPAGSSPAEPAAKPRVRVRAGSSPAGGEGPRAGRSLQTAPGGGSPPASPPSSRAMTAPGEAPRPAVVPPASGQEVAPRGASAQVPQRAAQAVPEGPRFVPSQRVPNPQIAGPYPNNPGIATPPSAGPRAEVNIPREGGALARGARRIMGPAVIALDAVTPNSVADATLPEGVRYGGQQPDEMVVNVTAPREDALPVPPEFVEPPPRRRRMSGSVRPGRMSEADELNEMSLRAIRGEAASGDPREARIRQAMGMKKGGAVGGKECYASGGAVGRNRDGAAVRGKTKGRFC